MTLLLPDGSPWDGIPREGRAGIAPAKAATGPGVGFFSTGTPMSSFSRTPQEMMKRAQMAYHVNPWVGTAESVVTRKVVGLPWHLEDGNDEEYKDDPQGKGTPEVADSKAARLLIERPQFLLPNPKTYAATNSRRLMLSLTSRHLGLCGMAHWYGDQMDTRGIPLAWLYINPARMWAESDERGNLAGWMLDARGVDGHGNPTGGLHFDLAEILTFYLDPADHGHYGTGIYERGILKAQLSVQADQHAGYVLGSGGRIAGIVSPKEGNIPDEAFKTLLTEFRNVNEAPDAAKRTTIMQGPIDFTPTAADPSKLQLIELAGMSRDDIFTIWGVPGSQAPTQIAAGMNSGDTKGYDEAILMQGAVHDRIVAISETLQYGWLDNYLPVVIELEIEEPEFDDETPAYERLAKAVDAPLTNAERREIVGLPPTGDPAIDNAILLPSMTVMWATAPDVRQTQGTIEGQDETVPEVAPPPIDPATGLPVKASVQREFLGLRKGLDQRIVPAVRKSVSAAFDAQRTHIAQRIRDRGAHLAKKPTDTTVWWNEAAEDRRMADALRPHVAGVTASVTKRAAQVLKRPAKADAFEPRVEAFVLRRATERIRKMNQTTREQVQDAILAGFEQGLSPAEVAALIEGSTTFDELRAERIARSEMMYAYNDAALNSYTEFGVEMVEPLDGDEDQECIDRLARGPVSVDEAMDDIDHPNGTLDWAPYFGKASMTTGAAIARPEPPPLAPSSVAAPDLTALITALLAQKAEPVQVTVVNAAADNSGRTRTVIDLDEYGDFAGYHEVVLATRDEAGDILLEAD